MTSGVDVWSLGCLMYSTLTVGRCNLKPVLKALRLRA